ncbi:helix-turn-helix domain-containing protein [Dethiobacter alkaliphilus]|uniref:helix-turn-helix domain-containing protein n=1 Tax=Dethiobacter alkaliphilus TaxID=427926 RepID=UPI002227A1B7|nr:helix-turn-helix transcriptional regulator [Dethiobacter alkaliphilus]MCW3490954.1 helix-turn-helix transcriptional regulator [Dethiobacter alkaliphilus]
MLYFTALTLIFLTIPIIFRYPFQLGSLSAQGTELAVGLVIDKESLTPPDTLTPTEKKVYMLLLQGRTNADIAKELHISQNTVKFHVRNTLRKAGVKNRKELLSRSLTNNNL